MSFHGEIRMIYDPEDLTFQQTHKLMIGSIIPRPIAFVATTSLKNQIILRPSHILMAFVLTLPQ